MSIEQTFAEYFKPEIQKRGHDDFVKGSVFVTSASDTQVQGLIRGMPPVKVSFRADSISSPSFSATCSCSLAAKGSYCKHMWAVILAVQAKHPDFLEEKTAIDKNERSFEEKKPVAAKTISPEAEARAQAYKEKQSEFKKLQYEKQKAYAKAVRQKVKDEKKELKRASNKYGSKSAPAPREKYADKVEKALEFFTKNGFMMEDLPSIDDLKKAKKHLSRVFHPDKGGTHDEAVSLNTHYEVLARFLGITGS